MPPVASTSDLKHKVLNDYNLVVARIFEEYSRTDSADAKAALLRLEDFIHDRASSLRQQATKRPSTEVADSTLTPDL
jgi:hypothetical protein